MKGRCHLYTVFTPRHAYNVKLVSFAKMAQYIKIGKHLFPTKIKYNKLKKQKE